MHTITLDGVEVAYELRPSLRAHRLHITVYPGGRIVVTVPKRATASDAVARFLRRRRRWVIRTYRHLSRFGELRLPSGRKDFLANKERARAFILERLEYFNAQYGFNVGRMSIRNNRSRWGSCSKTGNLNFSYRIIHLIPDLADYIIVHELCHLKEFNHSSKFWSLVALVIPDYKRLRRELGMVVH